MNHSLLEKCMQDLFTDESELRDKYSQDTCLSILRIRDMYLWMVARPSSKDAAFVKEDCIRYKITRPTAYADLNIVKVLVSNISKSSKEFSIWRFTEMILETYNIAKFKKDVRTMERAAATFAKYCGLDKEEEEKLPLDKIIPQPFIPVDDPSVLGFKPIPNLRERVRELTEKYSQIVPDIIDIEAEEADIIELPENNNNLENSENG